jgi:hypothetical protein
MPDADSRGVYSAPEAALKASRAQSLAGCEAAMLDWRIFGTCD